MHSAKELMESIEYYQIATENNHNRKIKMEEILTSCMEERTSNEIENTLET